MPLTHVQIWDEKEHGFRHITDKEAEESFQYGISSRSGILSCGLCGQNVCFTAPGERIRHFRHTSSDEIKICEDRQGIYEHDVDSLSGHTMPIRMAIQGSQLSFQMGFMIPANLRNSGSPGGEVIIQDASKRIFKYSVNDVKNNGVTYLAVGSEPSSRYILDVPDGLTDFWPRQVPGISARGALFEKSTGVMVPVGGKLYVNKSYYLLSKRENSFGIFPDGVAKKKVNPGKNPSWQVYEIRISRITKSVADFFRKWAVFLAEKKTRILPLWPEVRKASFFYYHHASCLYFYMQGLQAELKTYPVWMGDSNYIWEETEKGKVYKFYTRQREQLVALGLYGAISFSYLIKEKRGQSVDFPEIKVSDMNGNELCQNSYSAVPDQGSLYIQSIPYDGKVVLLKNQKRIAVYGLHAGETLKLPVEMSMEFQIFQGMDCVRTIVFRRQEADVPVENTLQYKPDHENEAMWDAQLVRVLRSYTGNELSVSHSIGNVSRLLDGYPETKKWIYEKIRAGRMSEKAYHYLLNYIRKQ